MTVLSCLLSEIITFINYDTILVLNFIIVIFGGAEVNHSVVVLLFGGWRLYSSPQCHVTHPHTSVHE